MAVRTIAQCNHLAPTMIAEERADGYRVTMSMCIKINEDLP